MERLALAYNADAGLTELFAPAFLTERDGVALKAWRERIHDAFGALRVTRHGRYLGQGQHLYSAEFEAAHLDLYLALDRQGRIAGLMLCEAGLMPLARSEDMRRCHAP